MFVIFTPYSFIFFSLYNLFLLILFTIRSFYYYWIVIEINILLFIGLRYTLFVSSYANLMSYFIIQALSSFFILLSYIYDSRVFMTAAIFIKLSMFPFYAWYINTMYRFPNFILWLSGTMHKLPILIILINFSISLDVYILWSSVLLTTLISGVLMLIVVDFRLLLILSSVGNNSWLLLSHLTPLHRVLMFFITYRVSLYLIFSCFGGLSKVVPTQTLSPSAYKLSLFVLFLSGLPPFPLFYAKILVIFNLLDIYSLNYLFVLFLLFNSLMVIGYIQSLMKYFIYVYSSLSHYVLKY